MEKPSQQLEFLSNNQADQFSPQKNNSNQEESKEQYEELEEIDYKALQEL